MLKVVSPLKLFFLKTSMLFYREWRNEGLGGGGNSPWHTFTGRRKPRRGHACLHHVDADVRTDFTSKLQCSDWKRRHAGELLTQSVLPSSLHAWLMFFFLLFICFFPVELNLHLDYRAWCLFVCLMCGYQGRIPVVLRDQTVVNKHQTCGWS